MDLQTLPWYAQFLVFLLIGGIAFGIFYMLHYSDGQSTITNLDRQIENVEIDKVLTENAKILKEKEKDKIQKKIEELDRVLPGALSYHHGYFILSL